MPLNINYANSIKTELKINVGRSLCVNSILVFDLLLSGNKINCIFGCEPEKFMDNVR